MIKGAYLQKVSEIKSVFLNTRNNFLSFAHFIKHTNVQRNASSFSLCAGDQQGSCELPEQTPVRPVRATELTGDDVASLSNPVFGVALPLGVKPPPLLLLPFFLASVVQDHRWKFDAETKCFPPRGKRKFRLSSRGSWQRHALGLSVSQASVCRVW